MVKTAVIPIAGKGTRFLPATKVIAKEIIPLLNVPMISYVVNEAIESGIERVVFITASGKDEIENYFDRNHELEQFLRDKNKNDQANQIEQIGNQIEIISVRQKEQLGLGHAIMMAKSIIQDQDFAVLLGDDLTINEDGFAVTKQLIESFEKNSGSVVGVMEVPKDQVNKYGIIDGEQVSSDKNVYRMSQMIEKPDPSEAPTNLATPGRYIFTSDIFHYLEDIPRGKGEEYQLTDAINLMAKEKSVFAHIFQGRRFDTGSLAGYLEATLYFSWKNPELRQVIDNFYTRNR